MELDRALMIVTPAIALATVGLGLRVGAGEKVRAALVSAAPAPSGGGQTTFPIVVFDDERGIREGVPGAILTVSATGGGKTATWKGATNEDGAAEATLDVPPGPARLEVKFGATVLASGDVVWPAGAPHDAPGVAWARFARREGDVVLDVALLGQRGASGYPADVWVRALDGRDPAHPPLAGAAVAVDADASLRPAASSVTTDTRGWAHLLATPLGYAVPLVLHATAAGGRTGEWAGGLFVSPGASGIVARDVYRPDEPVAFGVSVPTTRTTAYVEIDSAGGRVWAKAAPLGPGPGDNPHAAIEGPKLAPGLYWIVAASDPAGAAALGPGTAARPFFVAPDAASALAFGTDASTCVVPSDVRLVDRAVAACLALVAPAPVPRWVALDGFATQRQRDAAARAKGVAIALGAILLAILAEAILILRSAVVARARIAAAEKSAEGEGAPLRVRGWNVAAGLMLALLAFSLLAAFVVRLA